MYAKIESLLKERNETIADLSRATGINQSTFSNCKRRESDLTIRNAMAVAEYLGVSIDDLVEAPKQED